MRKLFGSSRRKKSIDDIKRGNLKIPVPMINDIEYANLPESQISTLIGGGNKGNMENDSKKPPSFAHSHKTSSYIEKPAISQHQPIVPNRSLSSPPILMPKPIHGIPPTRFLLKNIEYEKTQIENSSVDSSDTEDEDEKQSNTTPEIYPSNITAVSQPNTIKRSVLTTTDNGIQDKSPIVTEKHHNQSINFVTRTSDDSSRLYISASESPFFTASSVVSNKMSTSGVTTPSHTFLHQQQTEPIEYSKPEIQVEKEFSLTPKEETAISPLNENNAPSLSSKSSYDVDLQKFPKPPVTIAAPIKKEEAYPSLKKANNKPTILMPHPIAPSKRKTNSRPPTSSSGSSATVGHDVTHGAVYSFVNGHDKPPEAISSESSAFLFQNNNKPKKMSLTTDSIQEMLHQEMNKMALNQDLQELKRAVTKLQQDRLLDIQENNARLEQQKLTEIKMWEHINMANTKLTKLIQDAEKQQKQPLEESKTTPTLRSSNSTNTTRTNRSRASSNEFVEPRSMRQKHRRSFPSIPNNPHLMNTYYPDMKDRPPEMDMRYLPYFYQEYDDFPSRPYRKNRAPPPWIPSEMMDPYDMYIPPPPHAPPPPRNLSRRSSFHSAKSDDGDEQFDHPEKEEKRHDPRMRLRPTMMPLDPLERPMPPMYPPNGTPGGGAGGGGGAGNFLPPHLRPLEDPRIPPYGYPQGEYFSYMSPRMMGFEEQPRMMRFEDQPKQTQPPQQQNQMWTNNSRAPFWGAPYGMKQQQQPQQQEKENTSRRNGKTPQQMSARYPIHPDPLHF